MERKLPEKLINEFALLLEQYPPRQLSSGLRDILLEYLAINIPNGFSMNMQELFCAFNSLFDLLDTAAEELRPSQRSNKFAQPGEPLPSSSFSIWENP